MAVVKQRLYRKGSSGYDTIHLETTASIVKMSNGTDVETAINGKANSNHTHSQYLTSHQSLSGYATTSWVTANFQAKGTTTTPTRFYSGAGSGLFGTDKNVATLSQAAKYMIVEYPYGSYKGSRMTINAGNSSYVGGNNVSLSSDGRTISVSTAQSAALMQFELYG